MPTKIVISIQRIFYFLLLISISISSFNTYSDEGRELNNQLTTLEKYRAETQGFSEDELTQWIKENFSEIQNIPVSSFLNEEDIDQIKEICSGQGITISEECTLSELIAGIENDNVSISQIVALLKAKEKQINLPTTAGFIKQLDDGISAKSPFSLGGVDILFNKANSAIFSTAEKMLSHTVNGAYVTIGLLWSLVGGANGASINLPEDSVLASGDLPLGEEGSSPSCMTDIHAFGRCFLDYAPPIMNNLSTIFVITCLVWVIYKLDKLYKVIAKNGCSPQKTSDQESLMRSKSN
ncbi:MAG: hypothetical protein PUP46_05640 [Endozoicomonas sp. (ex Botrylloides leachii)]|nr:hypothetical protein [Endozoicomonas sp. (ex Botrylloides leachii)]